ncbi:MAG TPA: 2,3,4,5-tetrahydropyridine-2,6-dicarboxylate N-acetyltransferase [Ignavibacteriales bacterium]|nr:2,3,4,5-tetrahydropyridine-2,6-dicarboxylate N-acetyltransferase [Ignavibacteriales bacterium]HOL81035.1 2,3,4,5-tetrahydropyridine-2,6-dicarboxylate N-acetyltransferase [Ignavibacteriales bacterium]HOM64770.1 2,3,4,5-tetrahydropyridine-2,6-dicarboxylate N-acetyltransferase [Ignavibacteriales bacterium]HPD68486.1 2,3,4,5-tetrahydropyridine-2,6-dicarboxylate N-acetyltransferase [Ignavibacteriales bacterium]HPP32815.1 2,3,4,5-tetrahydropyridine-2,6-dicarboxylate N-acetyltransferase [Ignavibact
MDSYEIINYIAQSKKRTPLKVYLKGNLKEINLEQYEYYGNDEFGTLFIELNDWQDLLEKNKDLIKSYKIENDRRNSGVPLSDLTKFNARIEPGAIIRDMVEIGDNAIVMFGAVINIGAKIGSKTMIDMNAVIGGRAIIGDNCHIGAGAVVAGVIEPPSAEPVRIGDNVLVGANAVILEGVKVGNNSVIAAGAVVINDVPENTVVAGVPAKVIKKIDQVKQEKIQIVDALRSL